MFNYAYEVPEQKRMRLIIHTDCKNEADDQFAVVHQLLTPKLDVRGIVAAHFEATTRPHAPGSTVLESRKEIIKLLELMGIPEAYPVVDGSAVPLKDTVTPSPSPAVDFIIQEALRDDPRPLYIGLQGGLTDIASAILTEPAICSRMTAIWIGGGNYPAGNQEFNLSQDINAANVLFASSMPVWQVPQTVYKQFSTTLAELQLKVMPCGKIGRYLFEQMVQVNLDRADNPLWPHGEIWGLGDQGVIAALMEESKRPDNWEMLPAPAVDPADMTYIHDTGYRPIKVYRRMDARTVLEDFFAKMQLQFGGKADC
ncbi:MAG: nucleoside hydrolase [Clostridia bacterium]|nr:nucleoside hydrolase [Clostridia bacterium]